MKLRIVIASEAIQFGDAVAGCFVASLLAMTFL